jgi:hypothetical protein
MTNLDIAQQRLYNQHIARQTFERAVDVVQWLGAVQAQDYAAAKWALGLRLPIASDDDIERAFTEGAILRTHVMRPTWHFVAPADIRWLLALTAPRVHATNAYYYRQFELDDAVFARCHVALTKALQGGKQLTRPEIVFVLKQAGIVVDDPLRFGLIIMHAELEGVICSGARRGKQFTYALLDERAPQTRTLKRDEALSELVKRYFSSHGPATVQDFVWWSGLTVADAKAGLVMAQDCLVQETIDEQVYWFPSTTPTKGVSPAVYLLPAFDEYTVAYKERGAIIDPLDAERVGSGILGPVIVLAGRVVGTWKRVLKKDEVVITLDLFMALNEIEKDMLVAEARRYGTFLARAANVSFQTE